jgi:hypothetical protein
VTLHRVRRDKSRLTADQWIDFGTTRKHGKPLAGCVRKVCLNENAFVFAFVMSKCRAAFGCKANRLAGSANILDAAFFRSMHLLVK